MCNSIQLQSSKLNSKQLSEEQKQSVQKNKKQAYATENIESFTETLLKETHHRLVDIFYSQSQQISLFYNHS